MSNPVTTNPSFQDGVASVLDSLVTCLNSSVDYLYNADGIGEQATHMVHRDPGGQALGSHTQAQNLFSGSLNLQKIAASDADLRPGYILSFRSAYYKVAGAIGNSKKKNETVTFSVTAEKVINPLITTCLGTTGNGQTEVATGSGSSSTYPHTVANTRDGCTKTWALAAWTEEYPSATVPSGLTISSSTGTITAASVAAGTYYLKITCADSLTGQPTKTGVGFIILTLS